jgi:hypothetical protein
VGRQAPGADLSAPRGLLLPPACMLHSSVAFFAYLHVTDWSLPPNPSAAAAEPAAAGSSGGGWLGGWFGGKKEEPAKPAPPTDLTEDRFAPPSMPQFGSSPEPQFR